MAPSQSTPIRGSYELPLAIVDLTGEDAREWLQGQVTGDLRGLEPGASIRACLCKPTGQLLAHLEVWGLDDRVRLLIHPAELPAFLARVEEAVIMEDVEAVVMPGAVWHVIGSGEANDFSRPRSRTGQAGIDLVIERSPPRPGGEVSRSDGGGLPEPLSETETRSSPPGGSPLGRGEWGKEPPSVPSGSPAEALPLKEQEHDGGTPPPSASPPPPPEDGGRISDELWDVLTLAGGEPTPGADTGEKTLPPELGPAFEAATISYRKGCYTGQEVLMRMHSRGHANRTWRGLLSPIPLTAGQKVLADGAEVGRITRAGVHPVLGPIAAAFLRREAEGKALTVETPDGAAAVEARDLPLFSQ